MNKFKILILSFIMICVGLVQTTSAAEVYRVLWSHYTGWEPWQYIADSGIMKKWADKYGIEVEVILINDYVASINQYTAGEADACTMTTMDALTMPGVGGVESDVLIVGDYSNGNDGICLMNGTSVDDLVGRKVLIVQGSVSSYLLSRYLKINGKKDYDVKEVNTSDANIGPVFAASGDNGAVVTWNPILMQVRNLPKVTMVFDSSKVPGEIQDHLVIRRDAPDALKKALVGAWYEAMGVLSSRGKPADEAIESMAKFAGGTVAEFKAQLKTTYMFYRPTDAVMFTEGPKNKEICRYVMDFCFDHGLYGQGVQSADYIGVQFPDGSVVGDSNNVMLRYDTTYMKMAAEGKL